MKPYTPRALVPERQAALNEYYAALGVTEEIVTEPTGYKLKIYVRDQYIGGEQQLADALK
jgi:hypothetical protein